MNTDTTDIHQSSHILFVISDVPAWLMGALGLAEYLRNVGYTISFCGYSNQQATVEANGYPFYLTSDLYGESVPTWQGDTPLSRLTNGISQLRTIKQRRHEAIYWDVVQHFQNTIAQIQPDLILIDTELTAHTIVADATKIPTAICNRLMTIHKHPNVPPLHLSRVPHDDSMSSILKIEQVWLKYRLIKARRLWTRKLRKILADKTSILAHLAHEVGFDFRKYAQHYQWQMPLTLALPTLNLTVHELDFPHPPHDYYHYVGALIARERHAPYPTDTRLQTILNEHANDSTRKLIYCSFGSFFKGDDSDFWQTMMQVASALPDYQFVFGLGGRFEAHELGKLPDNVLAIGWVPQLKVLAKADCMLSATGINTLIECVHYEVPMVTFPFSMIDQLGNAARIRYHELGIVGDRTKDDAQSIITYIDTVLTDTRYKENLRAMRQQFLRYERKNAPVTVIQNLISQAEQK